MDGENGLDKDIIIGGNLENMGKLNNNPGPGPLIIQDYLVLDSVVLHD